MISDTLSFTHKFSEQLSSLAGKASFVPAEEIGKALQYIEEYGIPNAKNEAYKYCNIEAILRREFKAFDGREIALDIETLKENYFLADAYNAYVLNGRLIEITPFPGEASDGLTISNITETPVSTLEKYFLQPSENTDVMHALNIAYADRGIFIKVDKSLDRPLAIHYINSSEGSLFSSRRNIIAIEKNAEMKLVEIFHSCSNKLFANNLADIFVDENAIAHHVMIQDEGDQHYSVNTTKVRQQANSNYTNAVFTFSGTLVRNNLSCALHGENSEANLFGLLFTKHNQLVDNHTLVDHLVPNCQSNELYKGIAAGKSTAVFNGQIFVERDAQKTNAYQSSKNILLSDDATVNAKPELEIYANDVKCSHGTSTGKVDTNALFYLKARGIGEESARKLLLQAFAHEVIDSLKTESVKEKVSLLFEQSLSD